MDIDPVVQRVVDIALREHDVEALLAGLIRVAFQRRALLEEARDVCVREAEDGSVEHSEAAERLQLALGFHHLWNEP